MALWEWAVLLAAIALLVVSAAWWALNRTRRGRAILGLSMEEKLHFGEAVLRDRFIPIPAKILAALLVLYLFSPIDLIPDFIPFAGQIDDIALAAVVIAVILRITPAARIDRAIRIARSRAEGRRRTVSTNTPALPRPALPGGSGPVDDGSRVFEQRQRQKR